MPSSVQGPEVQPEHNLSCPDLISQWEKQTWRPADEKAESSE